MTTAPVVAPEAEAQCGHPSRTDVGKPDSGRQVCDDCKQIFQDGVPAPKIGQQLSDLATEAEVPPATKAAASRAKKARKPKVGKAEGAKTINLNPDELARGKKADEEDARQEYLKSISDDASFLAVTMKGFAALCKTADEAIEARDEFFSEKMKTLAFANRVQRVRDFASTKHNNEVLTIDGKEYKSVKIFFKKELGVTYEYVRRLGKKLGRLNLLLEEGSPQTNQPRSAAQPTTVNPTGTPSETGINVSEAEDVALIPDGGTGFAQPDGVLVPHTNTPPVPEVNLSFSIAERVQTAFGFAVSCTKHLSPSQKDEYYIKLINRLQDELRPAIDQTGFGYSRTAADLEGGPSAEEMATA
jgi:hypothetical protein